MKATPLLAASLTLLIATALPTRAQSTPTPPPKEIRVGIIGLDTSHSIAFTQTLNQGPKNPADKPRFEGVRVVAAYPKGSKDIESSTKRVPEYTEKIKTLNVEIVDSIEALLSKVDAVLLESNDGRVHLEQIRPILLARKPVFIDKPVAASLADVVRIFSEAEKANVPVFSSSSLRYGKSTQDTRKGAFGEVKSVETFSPVNVEPTHPELFWYGIHGCESLFTAMGPGCQTVQRSIDADGKVVVKGVWNNARTGTFRQENGKDRKGYGGTASTAQGEKNLGSYEGYDPLLAAIVEFFKTGRPPVSPAETQEIYAFMAAAEESKRNNGSEVSVPEILAKARKEVAP
jgi:predicted dehydrogenase